MIGRTWDRQIVQYSSQPGGPLKGAGGYIYIYILIYVDELRKVKDGRHFSSVFTIVSSFTRRLCYSYTSLDLFLTEIHDTSKITAFRTASGR